MNKIREDFGEILQGVRKLYSKYNKKFELLPEDSFLQKTTKIFGRVGLLLIMIILSPVLFIGLAMAFAAVF